MGSYTDPEPPPLPGSAEPTWTVVMRRVAAMRKRLLNDDGTRFLPAPVHNALLIDMAQRHADGVAKYGVPLTADNGRDSLVDLYQEILDACVYSENESIRASAAVDAAPNDDPARVAVLIDVAGLARQLATDLIHMALRVRGMLHRRDGR